MAQQLPSGAVKSPDLQTIQPLPAVTRWLLLAGIAAPFFFVATYLVFGAMRPGYSPVHQAISDLGVGTHAGLFDAMMALCGGLLMAYAVGFGLSMRSVLSPTWRWLCTVLLALHGLGLVIAAIFTEAPATLAIHWLVGADFGLFGPIIAFLTVGLLWRHHQGWRGWATFTLLWDLAIIIVLVLMVWSFTPGTSLAPAHLGGLMERVALGASDVWYVVVGWYLFIYVGRRHRAAPIEHAETTSPNVALAPRRTA